MEKMTERALNQSRKLNEKSRQLHRENTEWLKREVIHAPTEKKYKRARISVCTSMGIVGAGAVLSLATRSAVGIGLLAAGGVTLAINLAMVKKYKMQ